MKIPKMILFDYGQTLIAEEGFDGLKGSEAILAHADRNKYHITPQQLQAEADAINRELGRRDPARRARNLVEIPNHMFTAYLYESMGLRIDLPAEEIDRIFWDAASPGRPTEGIEAFLEYLWKKGIRTAVISNISYAGSVVSERIHRLLPANHFEFILASSEVLFRKPHPRIFRLALEMADLAPEEVWYIGDNYDCDVAGARNAGLVPVWYKGALDFEQAEHSDVLKIHSWPQLQEMIELAHKDICFYHGSVFGGLDTILANAKSHVDDKRVAYFTTDRIYALVCCRTREENFVTMGPKDGEQHYFERFPDQLKVMYDGREGFLYQPISVQGLIKGKGNSWVSSEDVPVRLKEHIPNVYPEILKEEAAGHVIIHRYGEIDPAEQKMHANYIRDHLDDMAEYKDFLINHFSSLWD